LTEVELEFFNGGRNFNKEPMKESEASYLLQNDLSRIVSKLEFNITAWHKLDEVRKAVLINMAFNLGVTGLFKFKNTLEAVNNGYFNRATAEMFDSKWRKEIGQLRFTELALQMATGNWFDLED
jgi:lysozyme